MPSKNEFTTIITYAIRKLKESDAEIDRSILHYFQSLQALAAEGASSPPRAASVLNNVVAEIDRENKKRDPNLLEKGYGGVASFFLTYLAELRTIICGKGKKPKKIGNDTQAVISALAAWVTAKLHLADPTAIGIAVLILLTLAQATKNTFCKMTDIEVYKAVRAEMTK